jgi:UDP-glucuronate decarboxylase
MKSPDTVTGPINLGNPQEFTILQLASQVIDLVGSRSRIVHRPLPQDDPRQRQPNIARAQEILDWSPRTPLAEGLKRTIVYFDDLLRDQSLRKQLSGDIVSALATVLKRMRIWSPQIFSYGCIERRKRGFIATATFL